LGSFLAINPETGWWRKLGLMIFFDNPLARWTGKRFLTPFDGRRRGEGINLFQNRVLPQRFPIYTYVNKSFFDQNPCLAVAYPRFPLNMFGLVDELRNIDEGVFLGQWHHKSLWGKKYSLQGYFVLCALNQEG
jgi:hypothetical protein